MALIKALIGNIVTSEVPEDKIAFPTLGIGVATVVFSKEKHVVGALWIALPESFISPKRALEQPGYFADTGIPMLISTLFRKYELDKDGVLVKITGGATLLKTVSVFDVGTRNVAAVKMALAKFEIRPVAEDVGLSLNRSLSIDAKTGLVRITVPGRTEWDL